MIGLREIQFPPFRERAPWWGADLQTLRNFLLRADADLERWPVQRRLFAVSGGDRLAGALHRNAREAENCPLVILIHGLTGCEDSPHIRLSAFYLLMQEYAVLRLNLRGSAPSRPTCRGYYHAGRSEDLAAVLEALNWPGPIYAVGYSLGGNMLLKYLGEAGAQAKLAGAAAISVPLDLAATSVRMMRPRNWLYQDYLLRRMKAEAVAPGAAVTQAERNAIAGARTVYAFDDQFVAPHHGFENAADYYRQTSAQRFLSAVEVPTLVVHSRDDPWIALEPYTATNWSALKSMRLLLSDGGGHVGFHGAGSQVAWHDQCSVRFFDAITTPRP